MYFLYFNLLLALFLCFFNTPLLASTIQYKVEDYLVNKLDVSDKRYQTFKKVIELMIDRDVQIIVETGTARGGVNNFAGDGGSSIIFSEWAAINDRVFYSVDIDPDCISRSKSAVKKYLFNLEKRISRQMQRKMSARIGHSLHFCVQDSIDFLNKFQNKIDCLYLDSYDFDSNNPLPSQLHHLYEIQAAYPKLHQNSIVMIDDCDLPHGGKGKLAIEYLTSLGWQIIANGYQVILVYPSN